MSDTKPNSTTAAGGLSPRIAAPLVAIVALVMRLIHLGIWHASPMFRNPELDPRYYDEWGQRIAQGDWLGSNVFEMSPLYSYFLGVVYSVLGHDYVLLCVLQSVMGAATCYFVYRIAQSLFGNTVGWIAGLSAAVYPVFVYYDIMVMKTSLGVFLAVLSIFFLLREKSPWDVYFSGLFLGGAVLVRDNYLAVAPLWAAWLALKPAWGGRGNLAAAGILIAGVFSAILPVTFRNFAVSGEFVLTTSGGGEVFYIGNNEDATGLYKAPPFVRADPRFEHEDFREKARELTGRDLSYSEASSYWFSRGLDFVLDNPGRTIVLYLKKFGLLWNRHEVADNYSFNFNRQQSWPLQVPLDYGIFAALGLVGAWLARAQWRRLLPLYLFFGAYFAGILPFFYFSRFRVPLTAILIPLAAYTIWRLARAYRERDAQTAAGIGIATIGLYALTWLPLVPEADYRDFSNPYEKLGVAYLSEENYTEAYQALEQSRLIDPDRDTIHFNLGLVHEKLGNLALAIDAFDTAIRLNPDNTDARRKLEFLREGAGSVVGAQVEEMRKERRAAGVVRARIHEEAAAMYKRERLFVQAASELEQLIELEPDNDAMLKELAIVYSQSGDDAKALEMSEEALTTNPGDVGWIIIQTGSLMGMQRYDDALAILRDVARALPTNSTVFMRIGQIERVLGNRDAAIEAFTKCLRNGPTPSEARVAENNLFQLRSGR